MRRNIEKIFTLASFVVALILIMVLLVTALGGIDTSEYDSKLVKGLLFTLAILYVVLAVVTIVLIFVNSDVVKDITLRSEQGGSIKVSANVISKYVKKACAEVEGVKCKKVDLISDEYGVRLKTNIKVVDKDVIEVETYLRTLLEDLFLNEFNFKFSSIEFKVTALVPKYKADQAEIEAAVAKKLAEIKEENAEAQAADEAPVEEAQEDVIDEMVFEDAPEEAPAVEEAKVAAEEAPVEEAEVVETEAEAEAAEQEKE